MSTIASSSPLTAASVAVPSPSSAIEVGSRYEVPHRAVRRFTVDEYHQLIDLGFFVRDDRYELLEGWIIAKMPRNPIHDAAIMVALQLLQQMIPAGWHLRCQCGFTTIDSEPEPDLVIVRGLPGDYARRHPGASDAAVVIEVANSTLADDRAFKARIYARAMVPEYWIINLVDRKVEVFSDSTVAGKNASFSRSQLYEIGSEIPLMLDGYAAGPVDVSKLLIPPIEI